MIVVEDLSKIYGAVYAVRDLSFTVERGEVVGFLGPNGAGKTTTLRVIAGFLGPSAGRVVVGGHDVANEPLLAQRKLGYMPEQCPCYPEMRVHEYLMFRAALKRVVHRHRRAKVERAMELARIGERSQSLIGHLSKGFRQRLGLADALVAEPALLILDEPTSGLDPNQIRDVRQVIDDLRHEHTILLSTHILTEVEASCDRAVVIHQGRLAAHGTLDALRAQLAPSEAEFLVRSPVPRLPEALEQAIRSKVPSGADSERWRVSLTQRSGDGSNADLVKPLGIDEWIAQLCANGVRIVEAVAVGSSLEDVFTMLTQGEP